MKHKRQSSSSKNGDEKSSKASSCNNDDDSDLDEGKTNCSDSGFAPTSDKTSENEESDVSLNARISPSNVKKKKRKAAKRDSCCVDGYLKSERSTVSSMSQSPSRQGGTSTSDLLCKMFTPSAPPAPSSHLLQSALSCSTSSAALNNNSSSASVVAGSGSASSTLNKMLSSSVYSPKDGHVLSDAVDCKSAASGTLEWSSGGNSSNRLPMDSLLGKSSGSSGPGPVPSNKLSAYYGRFALEDSSTHPSPLPLSSSTNNIKRNNSNFAYNNGSQCRGSPTECQSAAAPAMYFNYRQIKSENYPSSLNSPYSATSAAAAAAAASGHAIGKNANHLYNSFSSYCSSGQSFESSNGDMQSPPSAADSLTVQGGGVSKLVMPTYEQQYNGTNYNNKNCDYSGSKISGNMTMAEQAQHFGYGSENGSGGTSSFNGHLSSPEHHFAGTASYSTYPHGEQQQQHSKYLANYYDSSGMVNGSQQQQQQHHQLQHRIPSEYNAITLKQEQQLAGGCGYNMASLSNYSQHSYYDNSSATAAAGVGGVGSGVGGSGQILSIASSPNSIVHSGQSVRTPSEQSLHFAKGASTGGTCYENNAYLGSASSAYCDYSSSGYDTGHFMAAGNHSAEIVSPEYYQLS